MAEEFKILGTYKNGEKMKAAKRLETVQEYYFSQKLREVRALLATRKTHYKYGNWKSQIYSRHPEVVECNSIASGAARGCS